MAIKIVRYEGLRRSQSDPWDQAYVRSPKKDIGLIPSYLYQNVLARFSMQNSKKGFVPFRKPLSNNQRPKTCVKIEIMREISYASVVGSLM